jgi:hypothetical protein
METQSAADQTALSRFHDPGRGSFTPEVREPFNGVRHPDKTRQDAMHKDARPRHQAAQARRSKMSKS